MGRVFKTTGEVSSPSESEDEDGIADPTVHPMDQRALDGVLDLYTHADDAAAWHGGVTGRPLPGVAGCDDDIATIRSWIDTCHSEHATSCFFPPRMKLPKRVIDVGTIKNSRIHLVETYDATEGLYNTLSHCWGGKVSLMTTTENLASHLQDIPTDAMPKTFKDAVTVTKKLGILFL
ncbi:hypothetical protein LTR10_003499 [Elasticomyces elasticus]|nr:hypothetical protein LTR10_003499 [Elasticomyces elasticus]KAK4969767.1 hypothetical protein LTR42_009039 [Elasticomyces elasticus]